MKRELLKELGEAAYNRRKELMLTGAYPDSVMHKPDSLHFYEWDDMPGGLSKAVQEVFMKEAEAAIGALFGYILVDGSPEAKQAVHMLMREDALLSDEERAIAEGGSWQHE